MKNTRTLFDKILEAGIPWDHHESDLYVKASNESALIIKEHGASHVSAFRDQTTGELWFDCPFMYAPFWEQAARSVKL